MRLIRLAAASLALASMPARAADPAQIDCPLAGMAVAQRGAFNDLIATRGARSDARFQAYHRSVEQCAARFHWSESTKAAAANFGLATTAEAHMRRLIAARGIDLAPVESALLADRASMDAESGSPAQQQALLAFAQRNAGLLVGLPGVSGADDPVLEWIGIFVAARAVREGAHAAFLAD
jgi:hypothetical protein